MGRCTCTPSPDPDGPEHDADCPRTYDHLHTAEDLALFRRYVMRWAANADGRSGPGDHRGLVARVAAGVTARAVELGLEPPDH